MFLSLEIFYIGIPPRKFADFKRLTTYILSGQLLAEIGGVEADMSVLAEPKMPNKPQKEPKPSINTKEDTKKSNPIRNKSPVRLIGVDHEPINEARKMSQNLDFSKLDIKSKINSFQ